MAKIASYVVHPTKTTKMKFIINYTGPHFTKAELSEVILDMIAFKKKQDKINHAAVFGENKMKTVTFGKI